MCQFYCGYLDMRRLYELHRLKYLSKSISKGFICCNNVIDQNDYKDYKRLLSKYNISETDSISMFSQKVWSHYSIDVL